jgi:hypothetical protein
MDMGVVMKPHLRVVRGCGRPGKPWEYRLLAVLEWIGSVHFMVYPLLVVAFFWWLRYGHR